MRREMNETMESEIAVNNSKPELTWRGDAAAVADILAAFATGAADLDMSMRDYGFSGIGLGIEEDDRSLLRSAIMCLFLNTETDDPEHPGRYADYVGFTDFDVDVELDADSLRLRVEAAQWRGRA